MIWPYSDRLRVDCVASWPSHKWNVRFKMHAPRNTTIEASCQGGKLEYLTVTPPERKADVTVLNCAQ